MNWKHSLKCLQMQIAARSEDRGRKKLSFKISFQTIFIYIYIYMGGRESFLLLFPFDKKTWFLLIFTPTSPISSLLTKLIRAQSPLGYYKYYTNLYFIAFSNFQCIFSQLIYRVSYYPYSIIAETLFQIS